MLGAGACHSGWFLPGSASIAQPQGQSRQTIVSAPARSSSHGNLIPKTSKMQYAFLRLPHSALYRGPICFPPSIAYSSSRWTNHARIMHLTKQLAIFLDNRPGTLARVADALA